MEFTKEDDFRKALEMEEIEVLRMCEHILKLKPDVVITEKGVSDIA
jgi:T-complex protein 1 subunit gamma